MMHVLEIAMPCNVPQANSGCLLKMDGNLEFKQMYCAPCVQKSKQRVQQRGCAPQCESADESRR